MFFTVCNIMFWLSASVKVCYNLIADSKINRKGYDVNLDERHPIKQVGSFMKDYFYLFIPGYNIFKTFGVFSDGIRYYTSMRFLDLKERGRITKHVDRPVNVVPQEQEQVHEDPLAETPANEEVPNIVPALPPRRDENVSQTPVVVEETIEQSNEEIIAELEERAQALEELENSYSAKFWELKKNNATREELNVVLRTIQNIRAQVDEVLSEISKLQGYSRKLTK